MMEARWFEYADRAADIASTASQLAQADIRDGRLAGRAVDPAEAPAEVDEVVTRRPASLRPPLIPDWLIESDAGPKEAQVGKQGGVTLWKGKWCC